MKKTKQKIYYDKQTDVLWLYIKSGAEKQHKEVAPGINIEIGNEGELLGVEILNASKVLGSKLGLRVSSQKFINSATTAHKIRK